MAASAILFITIALLNSIRLSLAFDPRPLQDICVAPTLGLATTSTCKDPRLVTANDFYMTGLNRPRPYNPYGVAFTVASVATTPGFNTQGQTLIYAEFEPNGIAPPHIHPRASEIIYVIEGSVEVGFVTSFPDYKYYSKVIKRGDVFLLPVGLVHTVRNVARGKSITTVSLNSQNPGFIFLPDSLYAAKPPINTSYLARASKLDENTVKDLQTKMWFA
ncbi:germin-like protein subfamily 1 member 11 [Salvia splendens]|uniref:germin-like protein subfamily 1 member 11 n=1 Tax=Salvia splendens TaxID=180675 RepID=UPI0011028BB8|nr:germin-like protein subfamily 1 member 11 [Salvia splendens]